MTNLRQLLGANIKIYRNTCGISQAKLAERVDSATNYIAAIETGRRFPSVQMIEKIAVALKVDPPELFSIKHIPIYSKKSELEEEIWLSVGAKLEKYVAKNINELKKKRKIKKG